MGCTSSHLAITSVADEPKEANVSNPFELDIDIVQKASSEMATNIIKRASSMAMKNIGVCIISP